MTANTITIGTRPGSKPNPRIVLFIEDGGGDWHARRLKAALETRGARVVVTTLKACAFDTSKPSGLDIPGWLVAVGLALLIPGVLVFGPLLVVARLGECHLEFLRQRDMPGG